MPRMGPEDSCGPCVQCSATCGGSSSAAGADRVMLALLVSVGQQCLQEMHSPRGQLLRQAQGGCWSPRPPSPGQDTLLCQIELRPSPAAACTAALRGRCTAAHKCQLEKVGISCSLHSHVALGTHCSAGSQLQLQLVWTSTAQNAAGQACSALLEVLCSGYGTARPAQPCVPAHCPYPYYLFSTGLGKQPCMSDQVICSSQELCACWQDAEPALPQRRPLHLVRGQLRHAACQGSSRNDTHAVPRPGPCKWEPHLLLYLVRPQLGPAMLLEESARPLVPANSGNLQVGQRHQLHDSWKCVRHSSSRAARHTPAGAAAQHSPASHVRPAVSLAVGCCTEQDGGTHILWCRAQRPRNRLLPCAAGCTKAGLSS